MAFKGSFIEGNPHGNISVYDISGKILYNGKYENGRISGTHFGVNEIGDWADWVKELNYTINSIADRDGDFDNFFQNNNLPCDDIDCGPFLGNIYDLAFEEDDKNDRKYMESNFYKGKLNGIVSSWYDHQKTKYFSKIVYKRGKKNGTSYWYWPNGVLRSEITFSYDLPKSMKCYDKYGNKMSCF